jgi:hypothetical protein
MLLASVVLPEAYGAMAAASRSAAPELATVVHYTSADGAVAIEGSGALRAGSYVTLPEEVAGMTPSEVEAALEIQAGRGAFSHTFQTPVSNLTTPFNGPITSGLKIQFQLLKEVPIRPGSFIPTPPTPPVL